MAAVRLAAVVGSLVVLAVLLSPVSPFVPSTRAPAPGPSIVAEEPIDEAKIAPADVSPEDFAECNSVNDGVQAIVADGAGKNETYKIAADLLLGEYCNRPALVHEMNATADPALTLVAYACEAASGTEGDFALQDSLSDHTLIYCDSARASLSEEVDSLLEGVDGYSQDYLAEPDSGLSEGNSTADTAAIQAELDNVSSLAKGAMELAESGQTYDSVQMLYKASDAFDSLVEQTEA